MRYRLVLPLAVCLCVVWVACAAAEPAGDAGGVLARYVGAEDGSFSYEERARAEIGGVQIVELQMVSQTWRGVAWKHRVFMLKPRDVVRPGQGVLIVAGGSWKDNYEPALADTSDVPGSVRMFIAAAERLGSVVTVVANVPFQPMFDGKKEDDLIAYTLDRYLETGDETWPLLLPMTKSASAAMDVAQRYARDTWAIDIEKFTVAGASKRGWTTWLIGAVDDRVNAIAPIVIDMLNMGDQMHHQVDTWGGYSNMIEPYTRLDIVGRFDTPRGRALRQIIDPYAYRERLANVQKTVLLGTNDAYWPVDAANVYWDGLSGGKTLVNVPNAGHKMETGVMQIISWLVDTHLSAAGELELPRPSWASVLTGEHCKIEVTSPHAPVHANLWWADAPTRDFREARWQSRPIPEVSGRFGAEIARPAGGYRAAFVSLRYAGLQVGSEISTQISVFAGEADGDPQRPGGE